LEEDFYSFFVEVLEDQSVFYEFFTDNELSYTIYFNVDEYSQVVDDFPNLLQKGYAFGFRRRQFIDSSKKVLDPKVFSTIHCIILDFLKKYGSETILLYHCDVSDKKQACRNKLFDNWEKKIIIDSILIKHSINVALGDNTYFLGFITLQTNPQIEQVKDEFEEFCVHLIQSK